MTRGADDPRRRKHDAVGASAGNQCPQCGRYDAAGTGARGPGMPEILRREVGKQMTDEQLALAARDGDITAEEALLRRYKGLARSKAKMYYMVGADEDDVLQEGMIGLLKAVRKFEPGKEASFRTFAGLCVTNQIISAIRAADRKKHEILNSSVSLEETLPAAGDAQLRVEDTLAASPADTPEQMLVFKDIAECIMHNDRKIFSRYEMEVLTALMMGMDRDEIAAHLGKTPRSVENCLGRVRKKVRDYIRG